MTSVLVIDLHLSSCIRVDHVAQELQLLGGRCPAFGNVLGHDQFETGGRQHLLHRSSRVHRPQSHAMVGCFEVECREISDDLVQIKKRVTTGPAASARSQPIPVTTSTCSTKTWVEWLGTQ